MCALCDKYNPTIALNNVQTEWKETETFAVFTLLDTLRYVLFGSLKQSMYRKKREPNGKHQGDLKLRNSINEVQRKIVGKVRRMIEDKSRIYIKNRFNVK